MRQGWATFSVSGRGFNWPSSTVVRPGTDCPPASKARVAAVIATEARAIDDGMAAHSPLRSTRSWPRVHRSRAAMGSGRRGAGSPTTPSPRAYYGHRELGNRFGISQPLIRRTTTAFRGSSALGPSWSSRWSLPDAAGNPEFGLPRLPERDLPEPPVSAPELVYGRARRALFRPRLSGPRALRASHRHKRAADPAVVRVVGSGQVVAAGRAGLVPRLEAGGNAVFGIAAAISRSGPTGIARAALQSGAEQTTLNEGWLAEEARLFGKPLVVFLDQVEEVFTRSNPAQPRELDEFVAVLATALGTRDVRPRGKLVLGFRKEWLAETRSATGRGEAPRTPVFLPAFGSPWNHRDAIRAARPGRAGSNGTIGSQSRTACPRSSPRTCWPTPGRPWPPRAPGPS